MKIEGLECITGRGSWAQFIFAIVSFTLGLFLFANVVQGASNTGLLLLLALISVGFCVFLIGKVKIIEANDSLILISKYVPLPLFNQEIHKEESSRIFIDAIFKKGFKGRMNRILQVKLLGESSDVVIFETSASTTAMSVAQKLATILNLPLVDNQDFPGDGIQCHR